MSGPGTTLAQRLGATIREQRVSRGLSQEALAGRLGRTQTWLSYIEAGKREPRLADLDVLLRELGIALVVEVPTLDAATDGAA